MIFIFIDSYALKFCTNIEVYIQKQALDSQSFWDQVNHLNNSDAQTQQSVYQTFYWLNEGFFEKYLYY